MSDNPHDNAITDEEALRFHAEGRPGKLEIQATKPLTTQRDLSLAYSPGVAVPCLEIERDPALAYDYTAKGNIVTYAFDFQRPDGSVPVTGELISFQVDPAAMRKKGAGKPVAADATGFVKVGHKVLRPELVGGYSFEFPGYLVHFDPEEAAAVGLRAPVAQGLMSLTWMMEAVARDGVPKAVNIAADFRSPIFWDDSIDVFSRGGDELMVAKADGSICSLGRVTDLVR